jgi:hypothetical protein
LQAGQQELELGRTSLTQANAKRDVGLTTQAADHFASAKTQFLAAKNLSDTSRLLRDLEQIPAAGSYVYSRHTTVNAVAEMGVALSDAGQELSNLDGQLIKPPGPGPATHTMLTVLDQTQASLVKVRLNLDRAQRAAEHVDVSVLPVPQQATFLKARNAIAAAESGLDEFGRLVPVLKDVLGGNGPRTYLIEQVDPAELRAGGGFIGTYSLLRADQGRLTVIKSGDAYDLAEPRPQANQPGFIAQVGPLREVIPYVSWSFVDSNVYPDFASNAKAAEKFVEPRLGVKLDGVISMDYYVVAKMLELTGPLTVPGIGTTVDASSIIPLLVNGAIAADVAHKAIVSALAGTLMQRVASLPPDRWPALISALNDLAATRHLQAYFNAGNAQTEITRVGWSGGVNPTRARNYMMEIESNYYGDKANYFLSRHYTVVLTRHGPTLHHRLTIDLVNAMPTGLSDRTTYKVNVRLYVGAGTSSASHNLRPVKYANPTPPAGTELMDGWMADVNCCGGRGQAVFEYDTPWSARDSGGDQIYWQKQPGVVNDTVDVTWNDGSGHTYKVSGDLNQDRVITLTSSWVTLTAGQPARAVLPNLSLG